MVGAPSLTPRNGSFSTPAILTPAVHAEEHIPPIDFAGFLALVSGWMALIIVFSPTCPHPCVDLCMVWPSRDTIHHLRQLRDQKDLSDPEVHTPPH